MKTLDARVPSTSQYFTADIIAILRSHLYDNNRYSFSPQMSGEPSPQAETFRREIKEIISKADGDGLTDVERLQSKDGRITYIGKSLGIAVGGLMRVLGINPAEWGYTVWHFPSNRSVGNPEGNMLIVSLSDNSSITPVGRLTDPLTKITHTAPVIGSGSTVIVFLHYPKA